MQLTPADLVVKARIKLCTHQPFYGVLAMQLSIRETREIPTFATDGKTIMYNPEFVSELNSRDFNLVIAAVAHEAEHIARLHLLRCGPRDPRLYNIAGDYLINLTLKDCGLPIDTGWLIDEQYRGLSTDEIYDLLKQEQQQQPQPGYGDPLGGHPGCCQQPTGSGPGGTLTQAEAEQSEIQVRSAIAAAVQVARMQGKLPAHMESWVDKILRPAERWQDILREFITNRARDDYSWSRPNRAHLGRGIVLPSLHNYRMGQIVIALDSSGSCVQEFGVFLSHLNSIIEDCNPELVTVIHCDADIARVEEYDRESLPIPDKLYGGGGTDFRPVFEYIEQQGIEPECLIYFTDTFGDFPTKEPDYPVLWAVTTGAYRIPWGRVIEVTHDQR